MPFVFPALLSISAILFGITLIVSVIVKLVLYVSGKKITTDKKVTRKLLLIEFLILVVCFLLLESWPYIGGYFGY